MTDSQRINLINLLSIEGMRFLGTGSGVSISKAKLCFNLIQGIAGDDTYVPSTEILLSVNIQRNF